MKIAALAKIPEELAQEIMWENDTAGRNRRRERVLAWARARLAS